MAVALGIWAAWYAAYRFYYAFGGHVGMIGLGQRLGDVRILAESTKALVISAVHHLHDARRAPRPVEPLNLVIAFEGDRARRLSGHATPEQALAAAAGTGA